MTAAEKTGREGPGETLTGTKSKELRIPVRRGASVRAHFNVRCRSLPARHSQGECCRSCGVKVSISEDNLPESWLTVFQAKEVPVLLNGPTQETVLPNVIPGRY